MQTIDFNCDLGEGFSTDEAIMPYISSANIACGYHAGDDDTMKRTVEACLRYNLAIGAHPGFDDKKNFGRNEIHLSHQEIYDLVYEQVAVINKVANTAGAKLHHVKPHGALYNMAARDEGMAMQIVNAIKDFDPLLILYGLSGSKLISEGEKAGLKTASESFADRSYQDDGSLTPRSQSHALIEDFETAQKQLLEMLIEKTVTTATGKKIPIKAETVCIHGDGKNAPALAKHLHMVLKQNHIAIKA